MASEVDKFVGCGLDNLNELLQVPDFTSLHPVDDQCFEFVVTLIDAIGEYLLQQDNL